MERHTLTVWKEGDRMVKWKPLLVSLLLSLGVGGFSTFLTKDSMDVYKTLNQPPLAPPGWLFPVVWTILFIMMGLAAYLVWIKNAPDRAQALFWYAVQLAFNFCWTLLFFNAKWYGVALVWLLILWALILITAVKFYRTTPAAGWLMLPYLLWVTFAAYLNAGVWYLN